MEIDAAETETGSGAFGLLVDSDDPDSVDPELSDSVDPEQGEVIEISDSSDEGTDSQEDDAELASEAESLLEAKLQQVIEGNFKKYILVKQLDATTGILREQLTRLEGASEEIGRTLSSLRNGLDAMQQSLYNCLTGKENQLLAGDGDGDWGNSSSSDDETMQENSPENPEMQNEELMEVSEN